MRAKFLDEAKPLASSVTMPDAQVVPVPAQPEQTDRGTCRWAGKAKSFVAIGGQIFDAEISVIVTIPRSSRW